MKKYPILQPILLSIYPILSLYGRNQDMVDLAVIIWPLVFAVPFSCLVYFIAKKAVNRGNKATLVASLFIFLFFIFGYINPGSALTASGKLLISGSAITGMLLLALFLGICLLIINSRKNFETLLYFTGRLSLILVLMPVFSILAYNLKNNEVNIDDFTGSRELQAKSAESDNRSDALPDIYYIIADGYGRQDVLKDLYGFDNSEFLNGLSDLGFYVATDSHANYAQTYLSMSASLNFDYVDKLISAFDESSDDRRPLKELIKNNRIGSLLKKAGYLTAAFPSAWTGYADNLEPDINMDYQIGFGGFNSLLIKTTPINLFLSDNIWFSWSNKRLFYTFEHLRDLTDLTSPTFAYVHLLMPHPPFLYDKEGQHIDNELNYGQDGTHYFNGIPTPEEQADYRKKYIGQLEFLNRNLLKMINAIIETSPEPPIIILQSDHGPGSGTDWESAELTDTQERLSILNAYFVPAEIENKLYPSITPVNTYRLIANYLFGSDLPRLEDRSYFSLWDKPYRFIDVTNQLK